MPLIDKKLRDFLANNPLVRNAPFAIPWIHTPQTPSGLRIFHNFQEWEAYVESLDLHPNVWGQTRHRWSRVLKIYLLSWLDVDLIKAGELAALATLEMALKERYGLHFAKRSQDLEHPPSLRMLFKHLVENDGLTNDDIPIAKMWNTDMVTRLYERDADRRERHKNQAGVSPPITIESIRNTAAHGNPFETTPWGALLEVLRDLIHYADRDRVNCAAPVL